MVVRSTSSVWSDSPETIISHHYRLYSNVRSAIDNSPPFSMYNSPKSIHYIPRRASSADPLKRRKFVVQPRGPQRELSDFLNGNGGRLPKSLRLPLPVIRNPLNDIVKSKLLGSSNYQPPLHRKPPEEKPPLQLPPPPTTHQPRPGPLKGRTKKQPDEKMLLFKDAVFNEIIGRAAFTDRIIEDAVLAEMEKWEGEISWMDLEQMRDEIFSEFGVRLGDRKKSISAQPRRRSSSSYIERETQLKRDSEADVLLDASSARSLASKLEKQDLLSDGESLPSMESSSSPGSATSSHNSESSSRKKSSSSTSSTSHSASSSSSRRSSSSSKVSALSSNLSDGADFFDN